MSFTFFNFQSLPVEIKRNKTELTYWAVCFVTYDPELFNKKIF